jgi:hypothetical protein
MATITICTPVGSMEGQICATCHAIMAPCSAFRTHLDWHVREPERYAGGGPSWLADHQRRRRTTTGAGGRPKLKDSDRVQPRAALGKRRKKP